MAHVKTSRHSLLLFITFLQRCRNTHLENTYAAWQPGTLQLGATRRLLLLIHRNLPSRNAQPSRPETSATRSISCWMSSCWPSGWASFWWREVTRMPANASEENENDFRLFTRRARRCRVAMLLDLRP